MTLCDLELTDWLVQGTLRYTPLTRCLRPFTARGTFTMIATFNTSMW
jgi:hypothetical protein